MDPDANLAEQEELYSILEESDSPSQLDDAAERLTELQDALYGWWQYQGSYDA